jgi:tRNA(Ile)-lysidine synthase
MRQGGNGLTIIRPLLPVSREDTATYCLQHQLMPRIDTSNLSLSPLRNRIRHQLLPLLKNYNLRAAEALLRTARIACDDVAFIDKEASQAWDEIARYQEGTIILDKEGFLGLPSALKRHLFRLSIEKLVGNLVDIETRHIEELMAALSKPAGKQLSLPAGLVFSLEYDKYLLGRDPAGLCPFPTLAGEFELKLPGETLLPGWCVAATFMSPERMAERVVKEKPEVANAPSQTINPLPFTTGSLKGQSPFKNYSSPSPSKERGIKGERLINNLFTAFLDSDKTGDKLVVRPRQPGDRFQPLGMGLPKKLGEFMIDAKIPHAWRQRIPIVCSPDQILWVVGWRIDERVKVTEVTEQVLCIEFRRG